jgi:hypothetical protein
MKGSNYDNSPGFIKSGYINKKGTPSGESAEFNKLPPGQDIDKQEVSAVKETTEMPMKKITPLGYS